MTHLSAETLSGYIDRDLSESEALRVEEHLDSCVDCQQRLKGLRDVVSRLADLAQITAPTSLKPEVQRFVALQQVRPTVGSRLESYLNQLRLQSPLLPTFAVVLALVVIIYLLAAGVSRKIDTGTEVIVAPSAAVSVEMLALGERVLEHHEGMWIEQGLGDRQPVRRIELGSPEFIAALAADPTLADLESVRNPVRLQLANEVVEFVSVRP